MGKYKTYKKPDYPFRTMAVSGCLPGVYTVDKFGYNPDITTGSWQDIWGNGGLWLGPTQARQHNLSSTSACDTSSGCGARTVEIEGLTQASLLASETVTMNGTGSTLTAGSYIIIHRMRVTSVGGGEVNEGIITATAETDNTVTARIAASDGQTLMAIYQVPVDKVGFMNTIYGNLNRAQTGAGANFRLIARPQGEGWQVKYTSAVLGAGNNHVHHHFGVERKFAGGTILKLQADTDTNNADFSGGFDMIMIDKV